MQLISINRVAMIVNRIVRKYTIWDDYKVITREIDDHLEKLRNGNIIYDFGIFEMDDKYYIHLAIQLSPKAAFQAMKFLPRIPNIYA